MSMGLQQESTLRLQASETRFRDIVEKNVDGIIIVDGNGIMRLLNPAAEALFDCKAEELLGELFGFPMAAGEAIELDLVRGDGKTAVAEMRVAEIEWQGENAYLASLRDITNRKQAEEELRATVQKLRKTMEGTIQAIAFTVEARDPYTAGHQRRVTDLARAIATEMGLSPDQTDGIRMAGVVHDIGKIHVPAEILSKPAQLTESEFGIIKAHPQIGYDILKAIEFPWPVAQIVFQHHERMDGSGYPSGLSGEDILVEARILAVADTVEAMASHRPYRPALGIDRALEEISKNRGLLYDPKAVDGCLRLFAQRRFQLEVG